MKKIITVIGARPQFIKASVVSRLIAHSSELQEVVVHTGQHFDSNMSDIFFRELGMEKPNYFLDIHGGSHASMTGRMLIEIENILKRELPEIVLVYGDTNSTLAGALAAVKLNIPVAHVEAGLRSFNMSMPEEINRLITDRISQWLFTPTDVASDHLIREGFSREKIIHVGDVMYDAAAYHGARVKADTGLMDNLNIKAKKYILVTIHRAENTDHPERLAVIADALLALARTMPVVWPLHPRTRAELQRTGKLDALKEVMQIIDPIGYLDMIQIEKYAALIVTDSGGVQKEAFFYRVPCVTLRDETEWMELVEAGWNRLAPPLSVQSITETFQMALGSQGVEIQPYGDGNAADRIVKSLINC